MLFSRFAAPLVVLATGALAAGAAPATPAAAAPAVKAPAVPAGVTSSGAKSSATILNAVYRVGNTTQTLGQMVQNWSGSTPGLIGIMRVSDKLTRSARYAARVANLSSTLTANDMAQLAPAMLNLQNTANMTLSRIIARQGDFQRLRMTRTVKRALTQQRLRFNQMTQRITVKLPSNMMGNSKVVMNNFDTMYAKAVSHFRTSTYQSVSSWSTHFKA